ncbi:hypothetical protein LshimejAT787_0701920 [Lyophyllum shimeji]|uniref:Uncharacterized protein n=1 Tax=Lyophyllum shimeji TaxID=47721 RepID=A0A9P3PNI4_LYOSH|nr:hypothetical protein LshimejAT787_0701920 [Lyophyllum shimeji]
MNAKSCRFRASWRLSGERVSLPIPDSDYLPCVRAPSVTYRNRFFDGIESEDRSAYGPANGYVPRNHMSLCPPSRGSQHEWENIKRMKWEEREQSQA